MPNYEQVMWLEMQTWPRFSRGFVDLMRYELGDQKLDIIWDAMERKSRSPSRTELALDPQMSMPGCWVVVSTENTLWPTGSSVEHPYVIRVLDGSGMWPLVPGPWLIERLGANDIRVHGPRILHEADEMRAAAMKAKHDAVDQMAEFTAKDEETRHGALAEAARKGVATPSREEYRRVWQRVEQNAEERAARRAHEISEAMVWSGRKTGL